ncbi:MAG: hypothetical protein AAFY47_05305 [Pseudomonadota bacterium]
MKPLFDLLTEALDAIIVSFLIALAAFLVIPEWRMSKGYFFLAAWVSGVVLGVAAQRMGIPEGWDILVTAAAVITAPATIIALHPRSLIDLMQEIQDKMRRGKNDGGNDP